MDKIQTLVYIIVTCAVLCTYISLSQAGGVKDNKEQYSDPPDCIQLVDKIYINFCSGVKKKYKNCRSKCDICFTPYESGRWNATITCGGNYHFQHACSQMSMSPGEYCPSDGASSTDTSPTTPKSGPYHSSPRKGMSIGDTSSVSDRSLEQCSEIKKQHETSDCDVCFTSPDNKRDYRRKRGNKHNRRNEGNRGNSRNEHDRMNDGNNHKRGNKGSIWDAAVTCPNTPTFHNSCISTNMEFKQCHNYERKTCSKIMRLYDSKGCDVCFTLLEIKERKLEGKVTATCNNELADQTCMERSELSREFNYCSGSKPRPSTTTTTTNEGQFDAMYVVVPVTVVAVVAIIAVAAVKISRKSGNRIRHYDNALYAEGSSAIPLATLPETVNNQDDYAEIPADAMVAPNTPCYTYSRVDMSALDHHEYGHMERETNTEYSHLSSVNKPEHTDNTYSHISNSTKPLKPNQEPLDEDPVEDYNKVQKTLINKSEIKQENKSKKEKASDPYYSHLEHWQPSTKHHRNHIYHGVQGSQSYKQGGQPIEAKLATEVYEVCEFGSVAETNGELRDADGAVHESASPTPVTFALKQENENAAAINVSDSERHYFIVEKHEREADLELHDDIPNDHDYFVLEK